MPHERSSIVENVTAIAEVESPLEEFSRPNQAQLPANGISIREARPSPLQFSPGDTTVATATPTRQKRGPSLSRRSGQAGSVFQRSKPWNPQASTYGKFW